MKHPANRKEHASAGKKKKRIKAITSAVCAAYIFISAAAGNHPVMASYSAAQNAPVWAGAARRSLGDVLAGMFGEKHAFGTEARQVRTITTREPIPYNVSYIDVPEMYKGYEQIVRHGVAGERTVQAQVVFAGNVPVQVVSVSAQRTAAPIAQITRRGAKVLKTRTVDGGVSGVSFKRPVATGWLSADFYDYPHHNGIDFAAPYGTPVRAAAGGVVSLSRWYGEYGYCVIIDHPDGSQTLYAHNSRLLVSQGQSVRQGEIIAQIGSTGNSTGNHLHFEIRVDGEFLDPLTYIDK